MADGSHKGLVAAAPFIAALGMQGVGLVLQKLVLKRVHERFSQAAKRVKRKKGRGLPGDFQPTTIAHWVQWGSDLAQIAPVAVMAVLTIALSRDRISAVLFFVLVALVVLSFVAILLLLGTEPTDYVGRGTFKGRSFLGGAAADGIAVMNLTMVLWLWQTAT